MSMQTYYKKLIRSADESHRVYPFRKPRKKLQIRTFRPKY